MTRKRTGSQGPQRTTQRTSGHERAGEAHPLPLGELLDGIAGQYGPRFLHSDPIAFARRYDSPADREAAALIAALFAYGNVKAMGAFLKVLLDEVGPEPAARLARGIPKGFTAPAYRFQTATDVRRFLEAVGAVLKRFGSLEEAFLAAPGSPWDRIEALATILQAEAAPLSRGLRQLLPLPSGGSACKRWWMFLRWVVRPDDGVDLGLWHCLSPSELLIPIDTHLARIAYALGLTRRRTPDRRFAEEVTASLARFCPEDPTRYDFGLARLGILGACPRRQVEELCRACSLRPHCRLGRKKG
ncbi:MAG: TIGR02757 family protein [Acidobacteriota bacterium]